MSFFYIYFRERYNFSSTCYTTFLASKSSFQREQLLFSQLTRSSTSAFPTHSKETPWIIIVHARPLSTQSNGVNETTRPQHFGIRWLNLLSPEVSRYTLDTYAHNNWTVRPRSHVCESRCVSIPELTEHLQIIYNKKTSSKLVLLVCCCQFHYRASTTTSVKASK